MLFSLPSLGPPDASGVKLEIYERWLPHTTTWNFLGPIYFVIIELSHPSMSQVHPLFSFSE